MFAKKLHFIVLAFFIVTTGIAWIISFPKRAVTQVPPKESADNAAEAARLFRDPSRIIRGVYFTGWSAGTESKVNYLLRLKRAGWINAVVIDVKDFLGNIAYDINLPDVARYKAKEIKIGDIDGLIKRLHDKGLYVIGRIVVFEDCALAKARPDLAVKKRVKTASGGVSYVTWRDRKGLSWSDPSSREVWDYNIAIARDAVRRGFDELNFDYIRFPSDGDMKSMYFSFLDKNKTREEALRGFLKYLRQSLPNVRISADIFGLVAIKKEDIGVGQILEDIYMYFDYVCPMVYPSHYYSGTLGYKNPASHPYQIVKYSIDEALKRLVELEKEYPGVKAKLRPWLQDFDLGADYDVGMVKAQMRAVYDSLRDRYNGYMLWNPSNVYTKEALE